MAELPMLRDSSLFAYTLASLPSLNVAVTFTSPLRPFALAVYVPSAMPLAAASAAADSAARATFVPRAADAPRTAAPATNWRRLAVMVSSISFPLRRDGAGVPPAVGGCPSWPVPWTLVAARRRAAAARVVLDAPHYARRPARRLLHERCEIPVDAAGCRSAPFV